MALLFPGRCGTIWPVSEANIRGDRLRAAREAAGLKSTQALADYLNAKGFSYGKLVKIEQGRTSLSPQDAEYIAKRLGVSSTFFTAPLEALGDVRAGTKAMAMTPLEEFAADAEAALAQLDLQLDARAEGKAPGDPQPGEARPPRSGNQR